MGDRVAPYPSGAKDRKPIGLPRAAPLVQVTPPPGTMIQGGKPSLASIPKTAQNSVQPKRSRVSPDPPPSSTQPSVLSPTPEDQQLSTPAGMQRPRTFETGTTDQPTASTLIRYNSIGGEDAAAIAAAAGLPDPSQRLSAASDAAAERGESVSPDLMATDSPEHRIGRLEIEKVKQRYSKLAKVCRPQPPTVEGTCPIECPMEGTGPREGIPTSQSSAQSSAQEVRVKS